MIKRIGFKRLKEVLDTVNPNTVQFIEIELSSSCSSDMPSWADVKVGYSTYRLQLMDMDDRYWEDAIFHFFGIIKESNLKYNCNDYKQQTCNGYKTWRV